MQLNMLTLGHLSPSVISPKNLRSLLIGIASKLPPGILLPSDPTTELWNYYTIVSLISSHAVGYESYLCCYVDSITRL